LIQNKFRNNYKEYINDKKNDTLFATYPPNTAQPKIA